MIAISKLFLIEEGIFNWARGSIGSRFTGSRGAQMNRSAPRPFETGAVKVEKLKQAQSPMVEASPKKPVGFGLKPSGITT